ncbi:hypothetical protein F4779DRAFT_281100 [Xylariaceae sp. FL0662B]|nr:hypothetical protein F4779DRAFT_281100 [Xylariaceae sp. FL0662B]
MLGARIPRRNTSICAFCQLRLSLRPLAPRHRSFSTTKALKYNDPISSRQAATDASKQSPSSVAEDDDDWGGWGKTSFTPLKPTSQTSQTYVEEKSYGQPKQDPLLSRHEILARERLLANRPKPKPQPSVQARYVWDPEKQQKIEQNLRNDGVHVNKQLSRSGGKLFGEAPNLTSNTLYPASDNRGWNSGRGRLSSDNSIQSPGPRPRPAVFR